MIFKISFSLLYFTLVASCMHPNLPEGSISAATESQGSSFTEQSSSAYPESQGSFVTEQSSSADPETPGSAATEGSSLADPNDAVIHIIMILILLVFC